METSSAVGCRNLSPATFHDLTSQRDRPWEHDSRYDGNFLPLTETDTSVSNSQQPVLYPILGRLMQSMC